MSQGRRHVLWPHSEALTCLSFPRGVKHGDEAQLGEAGTCSLQSQHHMPWTVAAVSRRDPGLHKKQTALALSISTALQEIMSLGVGFIGYQPLLH